jgi:hypothetical protein
MLDLIFEIPHVFAAMFKLRLLVVPISVALLIAALWFMPYWWYAENHIGPDFKWFGENTNLPAWSYTPVSVGNSAEVVLAADQIINGDFVRPDGARVNGYSAKRYWKKENEIGLFSHTPDRCWTIVGWKIEPTEPDCFALSLHGVPMQFERRIFSFGNRKELVYFSALVGGKALPYRIDQYYRAARQKTTESQGDAESTLLRLKQGRLWGWAWESFVGRTPLSGPQQFIRISTTLNGTTEAEAEKRLQEVLPLWLNLTNYQQELDRWKMAKEEEKSGKAKIHR